MDFFRHYRYLLLLMGALIIISVVVIKSFHTRQTRHTEIREAFILLHTRGYTNEARRLYEKLLEELPAMSNKQINEDFQRTLLLVDPSLNQPSNLIWKYHWTVSNEMDKRSESSLLRALKLADEKK